MSFVGCKAAFFCGGDILAYLRDDRPGLGWAGLWDLPGGGREGDETPEECLLRELDEEFGLRLGAERLLWRGEFPSIMDPTRRSFFFGGRLSVDEVASIRFGDEGQHWTMMPVPVFLVHPGAVPEMQRRTALSWDELDPSK